MTRTVRFLLSFLLLLAAASAGWLVPPTAAVDWQSKVDAELLQLGRNQSAEFLVILAEQADLSHIPDHWTKAEKGRAVYEALNAVADKTQPAVLAQLETAERFWVSNMLLVRGDADLVERMARRPDVGRIASNRAFHFEPPSPQAPPKRAPTGVQWGATKINAPAVWEMGITGAGVTIAGQDTGYDWDHPALKDKYRGWDGASADHNYNWHDAIDVNNVYCSGKSAEPCDDHGHGTHTAGTMVGNDLTASDGSWPAGANNAVGVAPGASWIGCRNMNRGYGTPATYSACYQWFIAPTDLSDNNPDPNLAPHVINNSWGCPTSEGCTVPDVMLTVVQNVRAAGIVNVVSAGNAGGSGCGTVNTPAAIYDEVFSVGATTDSDAIASFSSRGPVTTDGSNRLKPDISAPGLGIYSSLRGGGYGYSNGTSMAAPHVAGLVALMISAEPRLAGRVDLIEQIIQDSAVQLTTTQTCGAFDGGQIPNAVFGFGRIDALATINSISQYEPFLASARQFLPLVQKPYLDVPSRYP